MKFGPERRVRKRPEFQQIQAKGRRVSSPHFVWIVARSDTPRASRLGVTVSKKVGNSVRRSRIKRLLREAFRLEQGMLPDGYDLVIICKKDHPEFDLQMVQGEWQSVAKRINKSIER